MMDVGVTVEVIPVYYYFNIMYEVKRREEKRVQVDALTAYTQTYDIVVMGNNYILIIFSYVGGKALVVSMMFGYPCTCYNFLCDSRLCT